MKILSITYFGLAIMWYNMPSETKTMKIGFRISGCIYFLTGIIYLLS